MTEIPVLDELPLGWQELNEKVLFCINARMAILFDPYNEERLATYLSQWMRLSKNSVNYVEASYF